MTYKNSAIPLQDVARRVGVANPTRDLVAERDQEAQRDGAEAAAKRQRFQARRLQVEPPARHDPAIETAIAATAVNFPLTRMYNPRVSTYIPCFATILYYLNCMDFLMAATKRWTDNCLGWVSPYSQIYISVLFYIQVMRAMESSDTLRIGSDISLFLREFLILYPLEDLRVPGPLVYGFKNLSCFWPSADNSFGNVSPPLPAGPKTEDTLSTTPSPVTCQTSASKSRSSALPEPLL